MLKIAMSRIGVPCATLCLCIAAACNDPTRATSIPPTQRATESVTSLFPSRSFKTLDEEFADLVSQAPGFGGLYQELSCIRFRRHVV